MSGLLTLGRPALGRTALKLLNSGERTKTGIWLAGGPETIANVGRVIKTCEPYESAEDDKDSSAFGPIYPVGTLVVLGKYNGIEITLNEMDREHKEIFVIVNESDILCTLEEVEDGPAQDG